MANELAIAPVLAHEVVVPAQPVVELPPSAHVPAPTEAQVRASDQAFSKGEHLVAGLIGMHAGILLLRDIAVDTLDVPEAEHLPRPKPRREEDEGTEK